MGENVLFDNKCRTFKIIGSFPREISRKTWNEIIRSDVKGTKVSKDPVKDRNVLKLFIKKKSKSCKMENRCYNKYDDYDHTLRKNKATCANLFSPK